MAGDANAELASGAPIVPWLAKTDANGNLLWQHDYYQTLNTNPLSEDFSAAATASDGGFAAAGNTEDYQAQKDELYLVKTDSTGAVSSTCASMHVATPLQAVDPALTAVTPSLPILTAASPAARSPATTMTTSLTTQTDC